MKDLIITVGLPFLVMVCAIALIVYFRPTAPACDDAVKPLVIECIAHGGGLCVEQVERLNGCKF